MTRHPIRQQPHHPLDVRLSFDGQITHVRAWLDEKIRDGARLRWVYLGRGDVRGGQGHRPVLHLWLGDEGWPLSAEAGDHCARSIAQRAKASCTS